MVEVLAPIGSIQALKAAIYSGADAVYFGLDMFNARIKADNFNKDNIKYYVDFCHLFGVKVYITFNTNIKESEMTIFAEYVDIAVKSNVDAFIVTDLGCLNILKKYDIPLHGSTQIGVHNLAGAKVLEDLGFTRVVVARETLLEDILEIRKNTKLEIEYFVHGALCVSFSGGCLISSMMSGDSGNRGRCNQPCRLKYSSSFSNKEKYLLSPKDQCFIDKLDKLIEVGVDSLKIEGRLKQPHYVGEVVGQYRMAVDNILQSKKNKIDYSALRKAYNRGNFTQGYNFENSKSIIFDKINGNIGEKVGKIVGIRKGELIMSLSKPLNVGDGLKIIKNDVELGGLSVSSIKKVGKDYVVPSIKKFDIGSDICLTLDTLQVNKYKDISPKLSIDIFVFARIGKELSIVGKYRDIEIQVLGNVVEQSQNHSATIESVTKQIDRLGDSNFNANIYVDLDDKESVFLPSSMLNNLRRELIQKLENRILEEYEKNKQRVIYSKFAQSYYSQNVYQNSEYMYVEVDEFDDNLECFDMISQKVNLVINIVSNSIEKLDIILKNAINKNKIEDIYLKLPKIARGKDFSIIENVIKHCNNDISGIVADNLYSVYLAKKYTKKLIGGIGLNIFNNHTKNVLGLTDQIMSVELTKKELLDSGIIYSYGLMPIMTFAHCPIQVNTNCDCGNCKYNGDFYYYDKRGSYLIKRTKLAYCQFVMFNQQKFDIIGKMPNSQFAHYVNLTGVENKDKSRILYKYLNKCGNSDDNTTCGHLFRGVK